LDCEKQLEELREQAVSLINAVWHGINWDNVSARRRMKIYEEFENKIKSATGVGRVCHFLEKLSNKMDSTIPEKHSNDVLEIIRHTEQNDLDLELLDVLRSETTYLVLLMRERNDELKHSKQIDIGQKRL